MVYRNPLDISRITSRCTAEKVAEQQTVRPLSNMAVLVRELWIESNKEQTFCLAGPMGDGARAMLSPGAKKVWSVTAESHFDAMTRYYEYMGWGKYTSEEAWDHEPYPDEWLRVQKGRS